jgi:hypothetical protein
MIKENKYFCRTCKKTPEETTFGLVNGKPRDYCKSCRNKAETVRLKRLRSYNPNYRTLGKYNISVLNVLEEGFYELEHKVSKNVADGFLMVSERAVYIHIGKNGYLIEMDIMGIATFLANKALVLTHRPLNIVMDGEPVTVESLIADNKLMTIKEVQKAWTSFWT